MSDPPLRADLLTTLSIFGKLMYPDLNVIELIGREQMKESKFFEEVMDEGRLEGSLKTLRTNIAQALEIRFGSEEAAAMREALGRITDLEQLSELHAVAIRSRRVADFHRALESIGSARRQVGGR